MELPEVRYLGGFNRTTERARTFADQHGGEAFATLDAILADDRVDAVALTTTKDNHVAPAIACLEAGKHVLLEKPVAPTIADMYMSGEEAAARVLSVRPDAKRAVCFHNAPGHVGLDAMCRGFLDEMKDGSGTPGEVILVSFDVGVTEATVSNYFTANPDTDALFTTDAGPAAFGAMLEVVRRENRTDDVTLVTFDVSPLLLEAVESGEAVAGIDQLMYMQGYLPAVLTRGYLD